jgi:protein-tyrosine phosphatase
VTYDMSAKRPTTGATHPNEIAPGVFVGGWKDAVRFEGTRFCVLDEAPEDMPPATHVPIYDEATGRANRTNLDRVAEEIGRARARGSPVLVFCGHGVRRSPLAAAWYLHRSERISLDEAYERIRKVRPRIEPARAWLGDPSSLDGP